MEEGCDLFKVNWKAWKRYRKAKTKNFLEKKVSALPGVLPRRGRPPGPGLLLLPHAVGGGPALLEAQGGGGAGAARRRNSRARQVYGEQKQ